MSNKFLGSILWILSVQYFVVQILVAGAYDGQFSLAHNTISDLSNTACAVYGDRSVCSPWHWLMNASFILLGLTQLLGALLFYLSGKSRRNLIGYGFLMLAGIGTIIVGLYPENATGPMHALGAALPFVLGNIALVVLSFKSKFPTWLKYYSILSGSIGLAALVLFMTKNYLGIGLGGMERVVAYPQTIWMIIVGTYYLIGRNRNT